MYAQHQAGTPLGSLQGFWGGLAQWHSSTGSAAAPRVKPAAEQHPGEHFPQTKYLGKRLLPSPITLWRGHPKNGAMLGVGRRRAPWGAAGCARSGDGAGLKHTPGAGGVAEPRAELPTSPQGGFCARAIPLRCCEAFLSRALGCLFVCFLRGGCDGAFTL